MSLLEGRILYPVKPSTSFRRWLFQIYNKCTKKTNSYLICWQSQEGNQETSKGQDARTPFDQDTESHKLCCSAQHSPELQCKGRSWPTRGLLQWFNHELGRVPLPQGWATPTAIPMDAQLVGPFKKTSCRSRKQRTQKNQLKTSSRKNSVVKA